MYHASSDLLFIHWRHKQDDICAPNLESAFGINECGQSLVIRNSYSVKVMLSLVIMKNQNSQHFWRTFSNRSRNSFPISLNYSSAIFVVLFIEKEIERISMTVHVWGFELTNLRLLIRPNLTGIDFNRSNLASIIGFNVIHRKKWSAMRGKYACALRNIALDSESVFWRLRVFINKHKHTRLRHKEWQL